MKFGPYDLRDLEQIESILKENAIIYELEMDSKALEFMDKNYKEDIKSHPGFDFKPECAWIDIEDIELIKLGSKLENYNISKDYKEAQRYEDVFDEEYKEPQYKYNKYSEEEEKKHRRGNIKAALGIIAFLISLVLIIILIIKNRSVTFNAKKRIENNINLPFDSDKGVIGTWNHIESVEKIEEFIPNKKQSSDKTTLYKLIFLEGGKTNYPWIKWTKGIVVHSGDKTVSKYIIKEINNKKYMFFKWKSVKHMKPKYYVLTKKGI